MWVVSINSCSLIFFFSARILYGQKVVISNKFTKSINMKNQVPPKQIAAMEDRQIEQPIFALILFSKQQLKAASSFVYPFFLLQFEIVKLCCCIQHKTLLQFWQSWKEKKKVTCLNFNIREQIVLTYGAKSSRLKTN